MTIKEMMPLDRAFHDRSGRIYNGMVRRFQERRNAKGRILQIGREIPFKLHEFRDWLEEKLGKPDGIVQCHYFRFCSTFISAMDLRVDHLVPVDRGGDLGLPNLGICCQRCNTEKGDLTAEEYINLMILLHNGLLGPDAIVAIRKRLRGSLLKIIDWKKKKPTQASSRVAAPVGMFDPDDF